MADITYFVALPFVATDDGVAPGEPVECLAARAAILRAESRRVCWYVRLPLRKFVAGTERLPSRSPLLVY